jgi:predicted transcriptional regulator
VSSLKRFWQTIESLPSLAAVEAEWRAHLRGEYDAIKPFLRPKKDRATSFPRSDGGLPYRVVEHGRDDLVGVCEETGETITLPRSQLVVYELDQQRLAAQVASALGVDAVNRIVTQEGRLFSLGSFRPTGHSVAAFLILPSDAAEVTSGAASLISQGLSPFLLLTPTRRFVTGELELRLRSLRSANLPLVEALVVADDGRWSIADEVMRAALPDRPVAEEPLSDRAQEVLVAMLQLKAVDSDSRQPTAAIAARAMGANADANSLKPVMSELATRQLIQTREGRGGGCWLTEAGKRRAEKLSES